MRICVLDLETKPDPNAIMLLPKNDGPAMPRVALHHIAGGSILSVDRTSDSWSNWKLQSWSMVEQEHKLIAAIEEQVVAVRATGGVVVTFGGEHHDLAVLRQRALNSWEFDSPLIDRTPTFHHRDMMVEFRAPQQGRPPSLRDLCASLGIPMEPDRVGAARAPLPPIARKSQSDVVSTFVLYLYARCREARRPYDLLMGWPALSDFLGGETSALHLRSVATHPFALRACNQ